MEAPIRWSASTTFAWRPIMTFTRRRMAVLDWFEENLEVLQFTDNPDHAGIALGSLAQRLRFDRETLQLLAADRDATVRALAPALEGVWSIVEPKDLAAGAYFGGWSVPLGVDYEEARGMLAARAVGSALEAVGRAFDAACLVDLETATGLYQIEFGVVTAQELAERLGEPEMGQLRTPRVYRPSVTADPEELASTSIFLDVRGRKRRRPDGSQGVVAQFEEIEKEVSELAAAIATHV